MTFNFRGRTPESVGEGLPRDAGLCETAGPVTTTAARTRRTGLLPFTGAESRPLYLCRPRLAYTPGDTDAETGGTSPFVSL